MSFDDQSQGYLENGYALGRGYVSSLRLNQQNRLLRDLVGYSIHPEILLKGRLPSNPRVADVGTGTGQWLIDTTDQIRSSQLDGFDISTDQFPNKAWLPANVSLHQLDITKPIPASLEGLYDLVHVQFFLCVVQRDGPAAILKELYKMLKPGGYLQWAEYDPTTFEVVSTDPSLKRSANEQHVQIIRGPQGIATKWPSNLSVHLKSTGFEEVLSISYPLSSELYAPFMQAHLCAAEEISFTAMKNDGPEAQGPLFRKLLADVYKECQTGVTMAESPIVVCGRKPASNGH